MARATTVFVTGRAGSSASAVLHGWLKPGSLCARFRPGSHAITCRITGVRLVEGDIAIAHPFRSAITGARYVFHVAATIAFGRATGTKFSPPTFRERASSWKRPLRAGVERVVYTSSVATLAPRPMARPPMKAFRWPNRCDRNL